MGQCYTLIYTKGQLLTPHLNNPSFPLASTIYLQGFFSANKKKKIYLGFLQFEGVKLTLFF